VPSWLDVWRVEPVRRTDHDHGRLRARGACDGGQDGVRHLDARDVAVVLDVVVREQVVDAPGQEAVATYGFMIDKMLSMPLRVRW